VGRHNNAASRWRSASFDALRPLEHLHQPAAPVHPDAVAGPQAAGPVGGVHDARDAECRRVPQGAAGRGPSRRPGGRAAPALHRAAPAVPRPPRAGRGNVAAPAAVSALITLTTCTTGASLYRLSRWRRGGELLADITAETAPTAYRLRRKISAARDTDKQFSDGLTRLVDSYLGGR